MKKAPPLPEYTGVSVSTRESKLSGKTSSRHARSSARFEGRTWLESAKHNKKRKPHKTVYITKKKGTATTPNPNR